MPSLDVLLLRLLLVVLVGGLIGAEREYRSKSAGFRTMILICLGSFLFTTFSIHISSGETDRIASNIVTGIGFIGAGVIFKTESRINGLTTAAAIWATAALGMGIADGAYLVVIIGTIVILISLLFLTILEKWLDNINQTRNYKIVSVYKPNLLLEYERLLKECNLKYNCVRKAKRGEYISGTWLVEGVEENHNRFVEKILHDSSVKEFEF